MSYTVTLVDLPNVSDIDKQAMEQKYRLTIEPVSYTHLTLPTSDLV